MWNPRKHVIDRAAKIDLDQRAGFTVENQDRRLRMPPQRLPGGAGDLAQIAGLDTAVSFESDVGGLGRGIHGIPSGSAAILPG
jgi:hypothetical protein